MRHYMINLYKDLITFPNILKNLKIKILTYSLDRGLSAKIKMLNKILKRL